MKLRNNKTGEIIDIKDALRDSDDYPNYYTVSSDWEEVPEEPKEYWYIDWNGEVCQSDIHDEKTEQMKLIGNYFETEEEAIKAKEHLLAWQRLKDKGFKFTGLRKIYQGIGDNPIGYTESPTYISFNKATEDFVSPTGNWVKENWDDLQLIFGGEE